MSVFIGYPSFMAYQMMKGKKDNNGGFPTIPYAPPMEIFKDKYYTQSKVLYKCIRDSGQPLSHNLSDLVGNYVEKA